MSSADVVTDAVRDGDESAATVHGLVLAAAEGTPDAVAVTDGVRTRAYAQVRDVAAALARALTRGGVRRGDRVGVSLRPDVELPAVLLGTMLCGAVYVPLDPGYPADRLAFMAGDAGLSAVVADRRPPWYSGLTILPPVLDELSPRLPPGEEVVTGPDGAYLIYTSGSTGRPKGVLVEHRNVTALVGATRTALDLRPGEVWSACHSYSFDFSVWEMWGCLATGGTLLVLPRETVRDPRRLHEALAANRVSVLSQTPTAFSRLVRHVGDRAELAVRLLVFGGEQLDPAVLRRWFTRYPAADCEVVDMYGITETTVHCTHRRITENDLDGGPGLVGHPLPGWRLHLLDERQEPVPDGQAGEIWVSGSGVARGYWRRAGLTADRFRPDPRGSGRMYRSGDRGTLLPDGGLRYLGRLDDQVKIGGHRIELGEIRATLMAAPGVHAAAVTVLDRVIVAYAVGETTVPAVRGFLAERLPAYLLPTKLHVVDELPVNLNGKLDVSHLPESATAPAESSLVERVCLVWEALLGTPVDERTNFFEAGGSSLVAAELVERHADAGLPDVDVTDIYRYQTPCSLAERLINR